MYILALFVLVSMPAPLSTQSRVETCEVIIHEPRAGQDVALRGIIKVTAKLPPGDHLWVFVRPVFDFRTHEKWWPQGEPVLIDSATGIIEHPATFGSAQMNLGEPFDVTAAVFGPQEHAELVDYKEKAMATNNYQPIKMPVAVCAAKMITVTKRID